MIFAPHIFSVFKQQVLGAFKNGPVLLGSLSVLAVSDLVDHPAEAGDNVEQIENDLGIGQFFLTALINGSHMSMATASIRLRWPMLSMLKNRFRVLALRSLPTYTIRPVR